MIPSCWIISSGNLMYFYGNKLYGYAFGIGWLLYFMEYAIFEISSKCNVDILSKISIYDITQQLKCEEYHHHTQFVNIYRNIDLEFNPKLTSIQPTRVSQILDAIASPELS